MSDRRKNSLEGYSTHHSPTPPAAAAPQLLKNYPGAETYKGSNRGTTLRLIDRKGEFDLHPHGHVIECSFRNGLFTIVTTSRSYILSGRNLAKIADLIDERKLKALHEYNPERHQKPEDSAIVVEEITRVED